MRITGGEYGGRKIAVPPGEIRPAMDRMRESVFSILTSAVGSLSGLSVLDLFSGSGSMALEALSRGARTAVLVERDRSKAGVIRENLGFVEPERWRLAIAPVERYLKRASAGDAETTAAGGRGAAGAGPKPGGAADGALPGPPFDLVFCDPPFRYPGKAGLLSKIAAAGVMAPGALLVIHYPKEDELSAEIPGLVLTDRRAYGRSIVHIYEPTSYPGEAPG